MLQYSFMQKSLLMGILIATIAPTLGYFLVLRRQSVIGDTLSHVALSGAAFGMLLNIYPVYTAIIFSVLASFGIEGLRKKYSEYAELSLSIVLSVGVGLASILISMGNTQGIMSYLFGSLSLVTTKDLLLVIILWIVSFIGLYIFYKPMFYITFDEEAARLSGIKIGLLNTGFTILVAFTVAVSMRIVGVLLISSLMVLPVATSLLISNSFKRGLIYSNIFGVIAVLSGLTISFYFDISPGGTIVLVSLAILLLTLAFRKKG